jgi:hypothetical protein
MSKMRIQANEGLALAHGMTKGLDLRCRILQNQMVMITEHINDLKARMDALRRCL